MVLLGVGLAQESYSYCEGGQIVQEASQTFEDYPAEMVFEGNAAPLDLTSHPIASQFQTALRNAVNQGVNFASKYSLASWGCGTACQAGGIVDLETGSVMPLPEASAVGVSYQVDSHLLIINPAENIQEAYPECQPDWLNTQYYLWDGSSFIPLDDK